MADKLETVIDTAKAVRDMVVNDCIAILEVQRGEYEAVTKDKAHTQVCRDVAAQRILTVDRSINRIRLGVFAQAQG